MLYEFDHQQLATFTQSSTATAEVSDEDLMARLQARDESALSLLMKRHRVLLRFAISRILREADTDDALQDVFVDLWNRADQFDATKGKVLGWMITMARRRAIDRVRRRQSYDRAEERLRLQTECEPAQFQRGADDEAGDSDRARTLRDILATLPEAQRQALQLAYFHGLSQREIAASTHTPLGTIKTRLELGVRKVRAAVLALGQEEWSLA